MPPVPTPSDVDALDAVVARLLDGARRPAAVVTDLPVHVDAPEAFVRAVGEPLPEGQVRSVLLVTSDTESLRTDVSRLGDLRWARMIGCVVVEADAALSLRPHPAWPPLADVDARLEGSIASTRIDFGARLEVEPVLVSFARTAAAPVLTGPGGLRVAGAVVPPADPAYAASYDVDDERPADVVLVDGARAHDTGPAGPAGLPVSPVIGRAPTVIAADEAGAPLDEAVYNPIGFRRTWTRGMVDLPGDTPLTPALVRGLRDVQGVRLGPGSSERLVNGLAMCGILTEQVDDPRERERLSVRRRREALRTHSTTAWRARLAETAGVRFAEHPADVVVTSDEPDVVTDLLLARRYSGADLVVVPDDDEAATECFLAGSAVPPAGAHVHPADRTPDQILAAGGLVYVTRSRSAG